MARRALLRASDADREQVTKRLQRASTEGRIAADELEQRLESALSARTYGELDAVLSDLPSDKRGFRPRRRRGRSEVGWLRPALVAAVAVPIAVTLAIAVVFAVTGVFAGWMLWALAGWWFFGRRRRRYRAHYTGSWDARHQWRTQRRSGLGPPPGSWV